MQSMAGFAAIVPLVGILIGTALGYFSGRLLETQKQLTLQKGQAYADYLKALATAATQSRSREILSLAADAKTRICIYGSRAVIRQLGIFEKSGAKIESAESRAVVSDLIKVMRRDMGVFGDAVSQTDLHDILFGPLG